MKKNLVIFIASLLSFLSCATTSKNGKTVTSEAQFPNKEGKVLELKARIAELNNRIFLMSEQIESLRARLRHESDGDVELQTIPEPPVKVTTRRITSQTAEGITAEQALVQRYLGSGTAEVQATQIPALSTAQYRQMYERYMEAYEFFKSKQYARALVAFNSFIESYPQTPLTDNAYFWMGESYYEKKEYQLAIQKYLRVVEDFPNSSKLPMAILKLSKAHASLGDKTTSQRYRRIVLEAYPRSRAASIIRGQET